MKIAIIGAAGKMGRWLIQYFHGKGHTLIFYDIQQKKMESLQRYSGTVAKNLQTAVKKVDLVIVSVPIEKNSKVLEEIATFMPKNSILAEISSIKGKSIDTLSRIGKKGINPLSIHPLFGPGSQKLRKRIAVIPIVNGEKELKIVERIFPESEIILVDAKCHDRVMALTLSLPYLINLTLATILKDEDIELLKKLSGTTFKLQSIIMGSILTETPEFHLALNSTNIFSKRYLEEFISKMQEAKILLEKNQEKFIKEYLKIQNKLSKKMVLTEMYEQMYVALVALERKTNEKELY